MGRRQGLLYYFRPISKNASYRLSLQGNFRDVAVNVMEVFRKNQSTFSQLMGSYVVNPLLDWTTDKEEAVGLIPARSGLKRDKKKRQ